MIYRKFVIVATIACAAPCAAQPTTGQQDMAAKVNCADFKSTGDGGWTGKDGKAYSKTDQMAVALQQKCTGKNK